MNIENYSASSGRVLKEDNTIVNVADLIENMATTLTAMDSIVESFITAEKTATTTPAEAFAGASRLANRKFITLQNVGNVNMEVLQSGGTNGVIVYPGDSITLKTALAVFVDTVTSTTTYRVMEGK